MKRWMPLLDTLTALALVAWVGGMFALGAFAAKILFRELPLDSAAPTMNMIFRSFDGVIVGCVVVVAVTTGLRLVAAGLRSRPDRIALVAGTAMTILGALDVGYVHPSITQMFREGRTQEPAFAALHQLSRRSFDLEAICAILILGALFWSRKHEP
jgi:putative copper export protein